MSSPISKGVNDFPDTKSAVEYFIERCNRGVLAIDKYVPHIFPERSNIKAFPKEDDHRIQRCLIYAEDTICDASPLLHTQLHEDDSVQFLKAYTQLLEKWFVGQLVYARYNPEFGEVTFQELHGWGATIPWDLLGMVSEAAATLFWEDENSRDWIRICDTPQVKKAGAVVVEGKH